jgi:hypothetical protein
MPVSVGPGATTLTRTRRGLRHAFHYVLACGINRGTGCPLVTVGRGYVDDSSVTLGLHHAQLVLHAQQSAEHIGIEGGDVALSDLLRHRTGLAFRPGGVDGRVEAAEAGHGLINQIAYFVIMTNVDLDE